MCGLSIGGEKMTCDDCRYFREHRGSRNWYGEQTEPDDYDCTSSRATEKDLDKYFTDAEDGAENCMGFEQKWRKEDFEE